MNPSAPACVELDVTIFVLLHGNFHVGSAWDGVSRRLEQLGHIAHAPTLPGHGQHVATGDGYQEAGEAVAGYIVERDLRDIVLVGHSGGGVAMSKAVELIADRVARLVYLSGWVLKDGESILEMLPAHYRELFTSMAANYRTTPSRCHLRHGGSSFINAADDAAAKSAFGTVGTGAVLYLSEPVNFTTFHTLTIPKSYILPTEDVVCQRRRVGLASAHDQPARPTPLPRNAGQPRGHVHQPPRIGRHDHRGLHRLSSRTMAIPALESRAVTDFSPTGVHLINGLC